MFIMTPFWGLGAATNTLVSFSLGENKKDQIASLLKRIIVLSLLLTIPFIFLNVFFGFEILNLIAENAEVALAAVPTLNVITVALVFFSVANIFFSAVTGSGNTRVALVMEVGTLSIYLLLSYWLGIIQQYSVEMVWLTEVSYFLLLGFVSAMYLKYSNWKETKI
jgi:Na+-driven multidrug efflux pump